MAKFPNNWLKATLVVMGVVFLVAVVNYLARDVTLLSSKRTQPQPPSSLAETASQGTEPTFSPCPLPGAGLFSLSPLPATAMVSFPGSGSTWTRHLLTTATGLLTGTIYTEPIDVPISDLKERSRHVITVKTHLTLQQTLPKFNIDRCVVLIRNPYDSLLAEFNRRANPRDVKGGRRSVAIRPRGDFEQEWPQFVTQTMPHWSALYLSWAGSKTPVHVMVYDRMTSPGGLERQLRHTVGFLNVTADVQCAVRSPEGRDHRQRAEWQREVAVFSQDQVDYLNQAIRQVKEGLSNCSGQDLEDLLSWLR